MKAFYYYRRRRNYFSKAYGLQKRCDTNPVTAKPLDVPCVPYYHSPACKQHSGNSRKPPLPSFLIISAEYC
ncbi:Uncharacterized protein HZ326_7710 [Fusarium oxysporum f. sp. albedinis]|nr:Uncharacterized protein HZ326_7710 [Fusarium oxysporum f. sp. albedinis]